MSTERLTDVRQHTARCKSLGPVSTAMTVVVALSLASTVGLPSARADAVYDRLMEQFAVHDNRLPGSEGFAAGLAAVSNELAKAGLSPRIQTYDTLVPETLKCDVQFMGRHVTPVYPVDNGVTPLVTDGAVAGPVLWGADGSDEALDGKVVKDAIVLLDFDAPRLTTGRVFELGARAVVLVGTDAARQWNVAPIASKGPIVVPRLFMHRRTAEEFGLLQNDGEVLTMDVAVRLRDTFARTLWVEIPGKAGRTFRLGREEVVLVSARLDTYGIVPDYCPDLRVAANAALLASAACAVAQKPQPERSLLFAFFGSHYGAQEGARHFFDAAYRANAPEQESLEYRATKYAEELARVEERDPAFDQLDLFAARDPVSRNVTKLVKERLVGRVNNANATLSDLRIQRELLQRELPAGDNGDVDPAAPDAARCRAKIATIDEAIAPLVVHKAQWNRLRAQLTERSLDRDDPENMRAYEEVLGAVKRDLEAQATAVAALAEHNRSSQALAERLRNKVLLAHFDFDFASATDPWLLSVMGCYNIVSQRGVNLGSFLMHFAALGELYGGLLDEHPEWQARLFRDALNPYYKPYSLCVPTQRCAPTIYGVALGCVGFQMMTVGDDLATDAMPTAHPVYLSGLTAQMATVVAALASDEGLSLRAPLPKEKVETQLTYLYKSGADYSGCRFVNLARASADVEGPARNALLVLQAGTDAGELAGISRYPIARINPNGYLFCPMVSESIRQNWNTRAYALGFDEHGLMNRCVLERAAWNISGTRIPLFYSYGGGAYSFGFGPDMLGGAADILAQKLNAKTDAPFKSAAGPQFSVGPTAFFVDRAIPFKSIGQKGQLLLGSTLEHPTGTGIPLDPDTMLRLDGVSQGANDYWVLNESRLGVLRKRNIVNDGLEILHAEAGEHLAAAQEARGTRQHGLARAHDLFATCLENRVYGPLRGVTDDLVKAVVVLLLLNIPFAFAVERLMFGFTSIYKQVAGFTGVFLATFAVLFVTHPAFALASSPPVIFLAFVIILLSGIAVTIVMGKIRQEIRAIQGLASTVHASEGDSNTALAAVLIGISGMRNRPLKTLLTAITVILLTFTILVFASFTSELGVVDTYLGKGESRDRIELHRFSYLDIPPALVDAIATLYREDYDVFVRGGMFFNPTRAYDRGLTSLSPDRVVYNPANGATAGFGAVMGIDFGELNTNPELRSLLPAYDASDGAPSLYLPAASAEKLGVSPGDPVRLIGRTFTYAGPISATALRKAGAIDSPHILPPDFESTVKNIGGSAEGGASEETLEQVDVGDFAWFSVDGVAVTSIDTLLDFYPYTSYENFITLYPRSPDLDLESAASDLAQVFQGAVHVKTAEGAKQKFFTRAVKGSGFSDVIVPLLLGGLIIFSSLMGSIVDREKEIFTYSALGLSPPDVGALFFAESAVYSVVGGMGGYLVSQVVAKVLNTLGTYGILRPPQMNFSSLSSVSTILIVMAVVMLSTIYPAMRAGKSASPGVTRKWKMPAPKGDRLSFIFPFTVSKADFAGILSFIKEHFENHGDATLGSFAAKDVGLFRGEGGDDTLGIHASISLAPFDLGIFQDFRMYSKEFEIKGIEEVVVELERIGGSPNAWVRGNRMFADELRRQFLLWRSLPIETIEHYRQQTKEEVGT